MGKPKALRNRDVLPTITSDKKPNKRINFDAAPEDEEVIEVPATAGKATDEAADEPEEVAADSAEILRMKELHESMVESYTRKSKRRKITLAPAERGVDADAKLDTEIFAAFGENSAEDNSSDEEDDDADELGWTIDVRKSNSRKIDGLEVTVLDESETLDPITSFELSDKVKSFQKGCYEKNGRVKYMNFVTQKKGGPSKQFAVK